MHEMSLVASLMELIEDTARQHRLEKVSAVFLKVGALAMVEPMTLRAAFEVACAGTVADGAQVVIEDVPVTCRCGECGIGFSVAKYDLSCPACGSDRTELLTGKELRLERLEGANPSPPQPSP